MIIDPSIKEEICDENGILLSSNLVSKIPLRLSTLFLSAKISYLKLAIFLKSLSVLVSVVLQEIPLTI